MSAATPGAGCALSVDAGKGGKVTGPGIDCPGDCNEAYPQGTSVSLKAVPGKGFGTRSISLSPGGCTGAILGDCNFTIFNDVSVSASFADTQEPDTTLTKSPKKKGTKRKVKFKFSADEPGTTFQCALDTKQFKGSCTSPYKAKVKPGKHVFMVRAIDPGNLTDPTPAKVKFKVVG